METKTKTATYTKRAIDAYKQRCKEIDLEAYNARNCEYQRKSLEKKASNSTEEQKLETKEKLRVYMKEYRLKQFKKKQDMIEGPQYPNRVTS